MLISLCSFIFRYLNISYVANTLFLVLIFISIVTFLNKMQFIFWALVVMIGDLFYIVMETFGIDIYLHITDQADQIWNYIS